MLREDAKSNFSFSKQEKICSKRQIQHLLAQESFFLYPFKCYYNFTTFDDKYTVNQVLICVPKRMLKHAVDRNSMKRRIREAYRLNKSLLAPQAECDSSVRTELFLLYLSKEILPFNLIQNKIIEILERLKKLHLEQ